MIGALDASPLATLTLNAALQREQLNTVTEQSSSGLVSQSYAGLGANARVSVDLRPQIAHATAYSSNIDAAAGRLGTTQTALSQIAAIADTFNADLQKVDGINSQEVDGVAANARAALQQVAGLLNSKYGDVYVFAGQDSSTPPVSDANGILSSSFFTGIQSAVSNLQANGGAATAAATLAVASPVTQSGAVPTVEAGPGERIQAGVLASSNTLATSTGASTTGSYIHDLLRSLATIGSLSSGQSGSVEFHALVADTRTSLGGAITAMATESGALGDIQSNLSARQTSLSAARTTLTAQVSSVEDVDMAATFTKLSSLQTQLQASYQLIAGVKSLTLANIL